MPSFFRQRSSSPTAIHIYSSAPAKAVAFPLGTSPVTSVSRPLNNTELWTLYNFESHARLCAACLDPCAVHKSHGRLCPHGHQLAQEVAMIVYSKDNGRAVFDVASGHDSRPTKVELPRDYDEVRSLLKAMERSLRHRRQKPIVSLDRSYYATERPRPSTPSRRLSYMEDRSSGSNSSTPEPRRHSPPRRSSSISRSSPRDSPSKHTRRQPEIVDWPEEVIAQDVRLPPSAWRNSTLLSQSFMAAEPIETSSSTPKYHRQTSDMAADKPLTLSTKNIPPEGRQSGTHSAQTSPTKGRSSMRPFSVHGVVDSAQRYSAMMSGALHPATRNTLNAPARLDSNTALAPAPEVPGRSRRGLKLDNDENKRASWYAGAPYQTELREPRKSPDQSEKKARRHSTFLF